MKSLVAIVILLALHGAFPFAGPKRPVEQG